MGMHFKQRGQDCPQTFHGAEGDWPGSRGNAEAQRVSITLDADRLCQLLSSHHLHVQDFSCLDACSRECVRRLLLDLIGDRPPCAHQPVHKVSVGEGQ